MRTMVLLLGPLRAVLDTATENYAHISESAVTDLLNIRDRSVFRNVREDAGKIVLRSADGFGSLITLSNPNTTDNWAVEFKVPNMRLKRLQKAGLFLWYTRERLEEGPFKGVQGKFTGFMAGIEFAAERAELVFSYNYGLDYENKEMVTLHRDHINPDVLERVDEITVKIVHTVNNFIMELYSGGSLIADSFRIHDTLLPVEDGGNHFALTTSYERCPDAVAFELEGFKILEREEGERYDPTNHHVLHNRFSRTEGGAEVLHAIANIEHFMAYAVNALGTGDTSAVSEMVVRLKDAVRLQRTGLDEVLGQARDAKTAEDGSLARESTARIGEFEERLDEVYRRMEELRRTVQELGSSRRGPFAGVGNMLFVFTILVALVMLGRQLVWRYVARNVCAKKE